MASASSDRQPRSAHRRRSRSRSRRRRRSVCLFGTSANPPTGEGGHRGIASYLSRVRIDDVDDVSGGYYAYDEVRVLPVYRHMYASKRGDQASFDDRVAMCRLAFEGLPRVTVSESERTCFDRAAAGMNEDGRSAVRVGTADLLDMLTSDEPDADFSLALGADTFADLTSYKWRRSGDVLRLVGGRVMVIRRLPSVEEDASAGAADLADLEERVRSVNEEFGGGGGAGAAAAKARTDESGQDSSEGGDGRPFDGGPGEGPGPGPARVLRIPSLSDVSSSFVRSCGDDEGALRDLLVPGVLEYIKDRRMYGFAADDDDSSADAE